MPAVLINFHVVDASALFTPRNIARRDRLLRHAKERRFLPTYRCKLLKKLPENRTAEGDYLVNYFGYEKNSDRVIIYRRSCYLGRF